MRGKAFGSLFVAVVAVLLMLQGCGDSSSLLPKYIVEYVPGTGMKAPKQGRTAFQLKITKTADGSAATGLSPQVTLLMTMTNGDKHSTPMDSLAESATPGTYDCTVYYLMASGPNMGTWEMTVKVDGETTKFTPDVAMAMGTDTAMAKLKGQSDLISMPTGTEKRSYYLFNDGLVSGMTSTTLKLFIAAKEGMMSFPALASGGTTTLKDENGVSWTADPIIVEASTDAATWVAAANSKGGHWSVPFTTGIVSGATNTLYVRLSVGKNGGAAEQKTIDGAAVAGVNGYQTILATPVPAM